MKRAMLTMVLAAAVVVLGEAAQAPPNLSGTWRPQNPNSGQVNPFEFTITQTADSVTIRTPLNTPESVTLKVNGEEVRTLVGGGQGGAPAATVSSRAGWEGPKLVVTSAVSGLFDQRRYADARNEQLATRRLDGPSPDRDIRKVHAGADAGATEPDGRVGVYEPFQRQGPDRLEGERQS